MSRKDYKPLPDDKLDRLKADAQAVLGTTYGQISLPAQTVYWMVMELVDSREEIFRLQLCETVDQILSQELDDEEEDLLAFHWPIDPYMAHDMRDTANVAKPAFPCRETVKLPCPPERKEASEQVGRRLPLAD
jgi:hypothetical protein